MSLDLCLPHRFRSIGARRTPTQEGTLNHLRPDAADILPIRGPYLLGFCGQDGTRLRYRMVPRVSDIGRPADVRVEY